MPSHPAPQERVPGCRGWVTVGTTSDLPHAARASRGWRGHGAAGRRREAGQEPQASSPASLWPHSALAKCQPWNRHHPVPRRGQRLQEEKLVGPAAPHAVWFPRVAAGPLSQRETLQRGTSGVEPPHGTALNRRGQQAPC